MPNGLHTLYHPLTATPFCRDSAHLERPPAPDLRAYIRCYWGAQPDAGDPLCGQLVIPDTCVDLILRTDASERVHSAFCALYDHPFFSGGGMPLGVFGVRFYPWGIPFFAQKGMQDTRNRTFDAQEHFPTLTRGLERILEQTADFSARCRLADELLRRRLQEVKPDDTLLNALDVLLRRRGNIRMTALAQGECISMRQLERRFHNALGMGPKSFASLIRYQSVWRDALTHPRFDVQDAVARYGFSDQAHLLNSFREYHSLPLREALALARQDVAFLQDKPPRA